MLTFNQFITEVVSNPIKRNEKFFQTDVLFNRGRMWTPDKLVTPRKNEHVSTMRSGHHVYKTINSDTGETIFHTYDPTTKRSTLTVQGRMRNGVMSNLYLASHATNKLPAHEFYYHLLKYHVKALVANSQSEGAKKVWGKLAKKRDVNIHGWYKGKPVNVKFGEDETHDIKTGDPSIRDMQLIAHIKDK